MKELERYFVSGTQDFPGLSLDDYVAQLERIFAAGITAYQFREKGAGLVDGAKRLALAKRLQKLAKQYHVTYFIDDDIALAKVIGADGIHVGQSDTPIEEVITQVSGKMLVGLSVSNSEEMKAAQRIDGIDYLGVGPIYPTQSKADASEALGVDGLKTVLASNKHQYPIVAIGGITITSLSALKQTGIDGVAVISLLSQAGDPKEVVTTMKQAWGKE